MLGETASFGLGETRVSDANASGNDLPRGSWVAEATASSASSSDRHLPWEEEDFLPGTSDNALVPQRPKSIAGIRVSKVEHFL